MIGRAVTETMKSREREEEKIGDRGCGETASEAREITLLGGVCADLAPSDVIYANYRSYVLKCTALIDGVAFGLQ